jgi:hypothetical protein
MATCGRWRAQVPPLRRGGRGADVANLRLDLFGFAQLFSSFMDALNDGSVIAVTGSQYQSFEARNESWPPIASLASFSSVSTGQPSLRTKTNERSGQALLRLPWSHCDA